MADREVLSKHKSILTRERTLSGAAVIAYVVAIILPSTGPVEIVRVILSVFALVVVPGWIVVRLVGGEWVDLTKVAAAAVISASYMILLGVAGNRLGLKLSPLYYGVPLVVIAVIMAAIATEPERRPVAVRSTMYTVITIAIAVASVVLTHLALPAVSRESSYSISAPVAFDRGGIVSIPLTVNRVEFKGSVHLDLEVNYVKYSSTTLPSGSGIVTVTLDLPAGFNCASSSIQLVAQNRQLLSPILRCLP